MSLTSVPQDIDDAFNFNKTSMRYYRGALTKLRDCVEVSIDIFWAGGCLTLEQFWLGLPPSTAPTMVVQLGDVIDGFNRKTSSGSDNALKSIEDAMDRIPVPVGGQVEDLLTQG